MKLTSKLVLLNTDVTSVRNEEFAVAQAACSQHLVPAFYVRVTSEAPILFPSR